MIAFSITLTLAVIGGLFWYDRFYQKDHTLLRNYPVIGRFRYFAESYGEYMRQYQYTENWSERPFNRLTRSWIYRKAKGVNANISFGGEETSLFRIEHSMYPKTTTESQTKIIGSGENAYQPKHIFNMSGMSFGALSAPAVSALAQGAANAGIWMNTGEGGLSKYHLEGDGDIVFQIGTAKYGIRDENGDLDEGKLLSYASDARIKMFEIKLSQGAKPGKGGILPAIKVTPEIAEARGIAVYEASESPESHKEINSPEDLVFFIDKIRKIVQKPVGIKLCIGQKNDFSVFMQACCEHKIWPDFITIDGAEGGTGSAPSAWANHVGLNLDEAIGFVVSQRQKHDAPFAIIASGKCVVPEQAVKALSSGADFIVSARGFMFSLGCIQAMKCGSGECPTGITSSHKRLSAGLNIESKARRVSRYAKAMNNEIHQLANICGLDSYNQFSTNNIHIQDQKNGTHTD